MGKFADALQGIVETMKAGDDVFQLNIKEVEESVKAIAKSEKKIESMGYSWEEVSPEGKRLAKKLAGDLNITEIEAYQLLVEHMFD